MKKLIFLALVVVYGCEIENINYITPIAVTDAPFNVQANSAILGGAVLGEGGKDVVEYGLVWSTNDTPTIDDTKIVLGDRIGSFSNTYDSFEANTTYFYRAYGISEVGVGYGGTYGFTTKSEPPCDPEIDNRINTQTAQITINDVDVTFPSFGFDDGNIQFETSTFSSTIRITVQFNEVDRQFPQTGEYTTVLGDFDGDDNLSNGSAKLFLTDFGIGSQGGATAVPGTVFYVEDNGGAVSVIFCDTPLGDTYVLNGKFTVN